MSLKSALLLIKFIKRASPKNISMLCNSQSAARQTVRAIYTVSCPSFAALLGTVLCFSEENKAPVQDETETKS